MREILFRAKRIYDKEWVEGDLTQDKNLGTTYICGFDYYTTKNDRLERKPFKYKINPVTICQFTGKTDEDGKKIFDRDIISFIDITSIESGHSEHSRVGEVVWDKEECCFRVTDRLSFWSCKVLDKCRVLGNMFDRYGWKTLDDENKLNQFIRRKQKWEVLCEQEKETEG